MYSISANQTNVFMSILCFQLIKNKNNIWNNFKLVIVKKIIQLSYLIFLSCDGIQIIYVVNVCIICFYIFIL